MNTRRRLLFAVLLVCTLAVGVLVGFQMPRTDDDLFALRKNFEIFGAVYEELVTGYVDPVEPERLMRDGVAAMLEDLDPYTTFFDEADNAELSIITRGQYGGVGLTISRRDGRITVSAPIEGASGYKQGVRAGDVITRIAGTPASQLSQSDVRELLRGEPGTTVEIAVERAGEAQPLEFVLTREQVQLKNVTYSGFLGGTAGSEGPGAQDVGYVKLERFTRTADAEVRQSIEALQRQGPLRGLVLDLRDNPGGLLSSAVDVAALFVPRGSAIVSTRGRTAESERTYRSEAPPLAPELPLVVLVNRYSASASEIVAGALQDLDRGIILGETTFGKGLVQVIRELPYNTSLKMTTARYYTPSGRSIQSKMYGMGGDTSAAPHAYQTRNGRAVRERHGIEPDVEVIPPPPSQLEAALQRRAAFFFFANAYAATHPNLGSSFTPTDETLRAFRDWLDAEDVVYQTDAERAAGKLAETLHEDGYASTRDEVAALEAALRQETQSDFAEYAAPLKEHLRAEILSRYADRSAQVKAALDRDPQAERAAALLREEAAYAEVLRP